MESVVAIARETIARCLSLAECTEEPGFTTRSYLSPPMREVHARLGGWMEQAGMAVTIDAVGNIRGYSRKTQSPAGRLLIGSHLDTVPHAGPFDGILGVLLGVALAQFNRRSLSFDIEVIGFSEEEGLRFGVPFIGSRALVGEVDNDLMERRDAAGVRVVDAIRSFGLDASLIGEARFAQDTLGYLEFHIEQGPVLESLGHKVGIVEAIAGQSRFEFTFHGQTNHAGTTPMHLRRDAMAAAAEWIGSVERIARGVPGLVATVGRVQAEPGAANVIPGTVRASLDVRHATDAVRKETAARLRDQAGAIADQRGLRVKSAQYLDQPAVAMDPSLTCKLERAVKHAGYPPHRMISGAGHDAMVLARHMPAAMLFLRSPGGISHDTSESVLAEDVEAALVVGLRFLEAMETRNG
jgi:allantoate deiminase